MFSDYAQKTNSPEYLDHWRGLTLLLKEVNGYLMKRLIQHVLGKFGVRLVRQNSIGVPVFGIDSFFSLLKNFAFAPRGIVDVGANHGNWTRTALKYFPDASYTLIEPQDQLKVYIEDILNGGYKVRWLNVGASDKSGSLPFHISYRDHSSTFVATEDQIPSADLKPVTVHVKTLNEILLSEGIPTPDIVKIDAEGFDLKVLAGASDLLGKTDVFLIEAMFCGPYENSVASVVAFMTNAHYRLIDITDLNRSPKHGVLWLCELAFLRNGSHLLERVTTYE